MKNIVITGGLGFIGGALMMKLIKHDYKIYLIVRPNKDIPIEYKKENIHPIYVDLQNSKKLYEKLKDKEWDTIFHLGALRGGKKYDRRTFYKVNVKATETLAKLSIKKNAKMVYCSSVGVFGAIPRQLPADENCIKITDNFYHFTKIKSESILKSLKDKGLRYVVIRPSITYGVGDTGFPYRMISMIDRGILVLSSKSVLIHLTNLELLVEAFLNAAKMNIENGNCYIIADKAPIEIKDLSDFITKKLNKKHGYIILPSFVFRACEFLASRILKNDLWKARFQLLSRDWYYNVSFGVNELDLYPVDTIQGFNQILKWYIEKK